MIEINKTGMCIGCEQMELETNETIIREMGTEKRICVESHTNCIHEAACKRICRIVKGENNAETD